ncbi:hypothetical protein WN944_009265 [Citrus x changshan-huyou]|uniref:non-specific serine/threonine protein kinase n=1 Tax=Citrus x changshan-huyou TaxID=2935761 RepID=A0AAP0QWR6_9ROSI
MASARLYFIFLLFQLPYFLHLAIAQNNGTVFVGATLTADNKDKNPAVPRGSQVKLTADQGLVLNDPQGKQVWSSKIDIGTVAVGHMNDTGNFVLASSSSSRLWDSFSNPTDALLPGHMMETEQGLFSRKSETNFSRGRDTSDPTNSSNSGYQMMFNESGYMYILRRNSQRFDLTTGRVVPAADFYHRATLNFDGVFVQSFYPKNGNGNWSVVWSHPENICVNIGGEMGSGACGYNNICSLGSDGSPKCACPEGYSLLNENDKPYNEVQCKNSCLSDCFCAAVIFKNDSCWFKKLPLSNGVTDGRLTSKAFMKYKNKGDDPPSVPRPPDPEDKKKRKMMNATGSVLLGSSVFLNFALVCAFGLGFFFIYKKKWIRNSPGDGTIETNLRCFSYKELEEATDNFKEEVGRGSFGIVYKGVIQTTRTSTTAVAVKKLDRVFQDGEKEFKNEVVVIGQTHHKNLVRLLGLCDEGQNRKSLDIEMGEEYAILTDWAFDCYRNGKLDALVGGDMKPCMM